MEKLYVDGKEVIINDEETIKQEMSLDLPVEEDLEKTIEIKIDGGLDGEG